MTMVTRTFETVRFELKPRLVSVRERIELGPRLVRVTLVGDDLDGFQSLSPTDHIKLAFPELGAEMPILPPVPDGAPKPTLRDYSVRAHRPELNELDVDIVLHGDGPAVRWAQSATVGSKLGILGPRGSKIIPGDFDWYVLAGDETAIPTISRWVTELAPGRRAIVVIEVNDADDELPIEATVDLDVHWVHRNGQPAGTTTLLEDALRGLTLPADDGFGWVAGEAGTLKSIRRYLRRESGMNPDWIKVDGYWRRGEANFDHHTPIEDDEEQG